MSYAYLFKYIIIGDTGECSIDFPLWEWNNYFCTSVVKHDISPLNEYLTTAVLKTEYEPKIDY